MKTTSRYKRRMKKRRIPQQQIEFWKAPSKNKRVTTVQVTRPKKNNKPFFSLNNAVPKNLISGNPSKMVLFRPIKMQPISFLKKESINQKGELTRWGDADFDGTMNYWDCDARNPAKDGIFQRALNIITLGKFGQSKEDYKAEKIEKKMAKRYPVLSKKIKGVIDTQEERNAFADISLEKIQESGVKLSSAQKKAFKEKARRLWNEEQTGELTKKRLRIASLPKSREKFAKERELKLEKKELLKRLKSGERVSKKDIRRVAALEKAVTGMKTKQREKITTGLLTALTPLGEVPEIRKKARQKGEKKGRGRPSGASGKYKVDGVPVYEAEFQAARSMENKKRKALGLAKIPTSVRAITTIKQAVPREQVQQVVRELPPEEYSPPQREQIEQVPEEEYTYKEGEAIPEELYEEPTQPQTLQQMQRQEQLNDNILRAPIIMKGELQRTGGVFQEDPRYNILNAPKFAQGELRNVGQTEETPAVKLSERPNPNPYGTEYTEIDPGSGRTIIKRRPQEKWATGEAL